MCEAASRAVCGCGETHLGGRSPGRVKGGLNAGFMWGSSLVVNPLVGDPGYGVLLMYGNASYIRCCNVAVNPLVGDVVGVTVVLDCCGVAARLGALEPEVKLQDVRLGAAVLSDGWRRLSLGFNYH